MLLCALQAACNYDWTQAGIETSPDAGMPADAQPMDAGDMAAAQDAAGPQTPPKDAAPGNPPQGDSGEDFDPCDGDLQVALPPVVAERRCLAASLQATPRDPSAGVRVLLPDEVQWFSDRTCSRPVEESEAPAQLYFRATLPEGSRREQLSLQFAQADCELTAEHKLEVRSGARLLARDTPYLCALLDDGELQCWGYEFATPVVPNDWPLDETRSAVVSQNRQLCSLEGGAVVCDPNPFALCDATRGASERTSVEGLESGVRELHSNGNNSACAVSDGTATCFGVNTEGQLGEPAEGCTRSRALPMSSVTSLGMGLQHMCATDGSTVQCWGKNDAGQLGAGNAEPLPSYTHTSLPGGITSVECDNRGCCVNANGALWCWFGTNSADWAPEASSPDASRPGVLVGMAAGVEHFTGVRDGCAVQDGAVRCWGDNRSETAGLLGQEELVRVPALVPMPQGHVEQLLHDAPLSYLYTAQGRRTCALIDGLPYCWGLDIERRLGVADDPFRSPSPVVAGFTLSARAKLRLGSPSCRVDGALECWGRHTNLLSVFEPSLEKAYVDAPTPLGGFAQSVSDAAPLNRGMAVIHASVAYTWGQLEQDLGRGEDLSAPDQPGVVPLLGPAVQLASGLFHACALVSGSQAGVYCWGSDSQGQLGDAETHPLTRVLQPVAVEGLVAPQAIDASTNSNCAIDAGGVVCWGGLLTDGSDQALPVQGLEPGRPRPVESLAVGDREACAVDGGGTLYCWDATLVAVQTAQGMVRVSGSVDSFCATDTSGGLHCWGDNARGQLGTGDYEPRSEPTPVPGITVFDGVFETVGGPKGLTCARTSSDGQASCWGDNSERQFQRSPWFVTKPTLIQPWHE